MLTSEPKEEIRTASPTPNEPETPVAQPDETPIDPTQVKGKLERKLSLRPEKQDLVEKNILKSAYISLYGTLF